MSTIVCINCIIWGVASSYKGLDCSRKLPIIYATIYNKLGKFTMVSQPIDLGWLVEGSCSIDLLLLETLIGVRLKLHHP